MRKSLPRTPPSGLSSRVVAVPPALLSAGVARRPPAARRNGAAGNGGASDVPTHERDGVLVARLRLLEGFLNRTEIADSAQHALQWLGEAAGVTQSICLVKPAGEQTL